LGWAGLAFGGYYLPNYELTLLPYLPGFLKSLVPGFLAGNFGQASGTFYSLGQAALYALAYLPLALVTLWRKTWRSAPEIIVLLVASFIFSCGIFLSRRFIPVLDLMVILLAAITLAQVSKRILISYLLILAGIFGQLFPSQSASLIADDELAEIKLLTTTEPEAHILVADNEYTPWIYGYSGRPAIAPGFGQFDIYWTNADWNQFWLSDDRQTEIDLLKKLPQPLYIYLGDRQRQIKFKPLGDCFSRYSWHVYRFRCGGKL
jgi:hypothetical protein